MEKLLVKAKLENFNKCSDFIEEQLDKVGFDNSAKFKILTACEEIIVNVMNYAYSEGDGDLMVTIGDSVDSIKITFSDDGVPFNPLDKPDADVTLALEDRKIGGLGILMVKKLMDDVYYEYKDKRNVLTIIKNLNADIS